MPTPRQFDWDSHNPTSEESDQLNAVYEAERRGILPPDRQEALDEARKRGLLPSPNWSGTGRPTILSPEREEEFQKWYREVSPPEIGDADDYRQQYDARAAFAGGMVPDEAGHGSSAYKADDHPDRFIQDNGKLVDTRSGQILEGAEGYAPEDLGVPEGIMTGPPVGPYREQFGAGLIEGFVTPLAAVAELAQAPPSSVPFEIADPEGKEPLSVDEIMALPPEQRQPYLEGDKVPWTRELVLQDIKAKLAAANLAPTPDNIGKLIMRQGGHLVGILPYLSLMFTGAHAIMPATMAGRTAASALVGGGLSALQSGVETTPAEAGKSAAFLAMFPWMQRVPGGVIPRAAAGAAGGAGFSLATGASKEELMMNALMSTFFAATGKTTDVPMGIGRAPKPPPRTTPTLEPAQGVADYIAAELQARELAPRQAEAQRRAGGTAAEGQARAAKDIAEAAELRLELSQAEGEARRAEELAPFEPKAEKAAPPPSDQPSLQRSKAKMGPPPEGEGFQREPEPRKRPVEPVPKKAVKPPPKAKKAPRRAKAAPRKVKPKEVSKEAPKAPGVEGEVVSTFATTGKGKGMAETDARIRNRQGKTSVFKARPNRETKRWETVDTSKPEGVEKRTITTEGLAPKVKVATKFRNVEPGEALVEKPVTAEETVQTTAGPKKQTLITGTPKQEIVTKSRAKPPQKEGIKALEPVESEVEAVGLFADPEAPSERFEVTQRAHGGYRVIDTEFPGVGRKEIGPVHKSEEAAAEYAADRRAQFVDMTEAKNFDEVVDFLADPEGQATAIAQEEGTILEGQAEGEAQLAQEKAAIYAVDDYSQMVKDIDTELKGVGGIRYDTDPTSGKPINKGEFQDISSEIINVKGKGIFLQRGKPKGAVEGMHLDTFVEKLRHEKKFFGTDDQFIELLGELYPKVAKRKGQPRRKKGAPPVAGSASISESLGFAIWKKLNVKLGHEEARTVLKGRRLFDVPLLELAAFAKEKNIDLHPKIMGAVRFIEGLKAAGLSTFEVDSVLELWENPRFRSAIERGPKNVQARQATMDLIDEKLTEEYMLPEELRTTPVGAGHKWFKGAHRTVGFDIFLRALKYKTDSILQKRKYHNIKRDILKSVKPSIFKWREKVRLPIREKIFKASMPPELLKKFFGVEPEALELTPAERVMVDRMRTEYWDEAAKEFGLPYKKDYVPLVDLDSPKDWRVPKFAPREIEDIHRLPQYGLQENPTLDIWEVAGRYIERNVEVKNYNPMMKEIAPMIEELEPSRKQLAEQWLSHTVKGIPTDAQKYLNRSLKSLGAKIGLNLSDRAYERLASDLHGAHLTGAIGFRLRLAIRNAGQRHLIWVKAGTEAYIWASKARGTAEGRALLKESEVLRARTIEFQEEFAAELPSLWPRKIKEIAMWMYKRVDRKSVEKGFLAGFRKSIREGNSREQAIVDGDIMAADTQWVYGIGSPGIQTGAAGIISWYWSWPLNYVDFLHQMLKSPIKNAPQVGRFMTAALFAYTIKEATGIDVPSWAFFGPAVQFGRRVPLGPVPGALFDVSKGLLSMYPGDDVESETKSFKQAWRKVRPMFPPSYLIFYDLKKLSERDAMGFLFHMRKDRPDKGGFFTGPKEKPPASRRRRATRSQRKRPSRSIRRPRS